MEKHAQTKQQFQLLLDRANTRFGKLRELQSRGESAWSVVQPYFSKTFDSFSKLWQFQLHNRGVLLEAGLQRSDLGGIASKIGQLYYNYYLRSGDTGALLESYTFYDAIQTRQYFASSAGSPDTVAAARQLRFYARFIVVCLFLGRNEEAVQLLQELQACVSSYTLTSAPPDAADWQAVLGEVSCLVGAHVATPLPRSPASVERPFKPALRCSATGPIAACTPHRSRLREAILVSYRPRQIKVAELPLELYRLAQALEWQREPQDGRPGGAGQPGGREARHEAGVQGQAQERVPGAAALASGTSGSDGATREQHGAAPHAFGPDSDAGGAMTAREGGGGGPATVTGHHADGGGAGHGAGPPCPPPPVRTPPRQLLYRPSAQQLLAALLAVTGSVSAPEEEFVLLYICADAAPGGGQPMPQPPADSAAAASGGGGGGAPASGRACPGSSGAAEPPSCPPSREGTASHQQHQLRQQRQLLLCPASQRHHAHTHGLTSHLPSARRPAGSDRPPAQQHGPHGPHGAGAAPAPTATAAAAASVVSPDCCLLPDELLVATRRRLLLVLDSDMSTDFARLQGQERGYPLLCLMSPTQHLPAPAPDPGRTGSLTTLALACPAQALCVLVGQLDPPPEDLQRLQAVLDEELSRLAARMARQMGTQGQAQGPESATSGAAGPGADGGTAAMPAADGETGCGGVAGGPVRGPAGWSLVFQDVLARRLLLHFAFFRCCMALHSRNRCGADAEALLPSCSPPLPPAADASDAALRRAVLRAAAVLGGEAVFGGGGGSVGAGEPGLEPSERDGQVPQGG